MGLMAKAFGLVTRGASMMPGPIGIGGRVASALGKIGQLKTRIGGIVGTVPTIVKKGGAIAGAGAVFEAGGEMFRRTRSGKIVPAGRHRRRGQGLSARDIRGAQKVARLVQHFGYKPKIKPRKHKRY